MRRRPSRTESIERNKRLSAGLLRRVEISASVSTPRRFRSTHLSGPRCFLLLLLEVELELCPCLCSVLNDASDVVEAVEVGLRGRRRQVIGRVGAVARDEDDLMTSVRYETSRGVTFGSISDV